MYQLSLGSAKLVGQSIGCFGDSENRRKADVGTNMAAAAASLVTSPGVPPCVPPCLLADALPKSRRGGRLAPPAYKDVSFALLLSILDEFWISNIFAE